MADLPSVVADVCYAAWHTEHIPAAVVAEDNRVLTRADRNIEFEPEVAGGAQQLATVAALTGLGRYRPDPHGQRRVADYPLQPCRAGRCLPRPTRKGYVCDRRDQLPEEEVDLDSPAAMAEEGVNGEPPVGHPRHQSPANSPSSG